MTAKNDEIIKILKTRFATNMSRHKNLSWDKIETKLLSSPKKLNSLIEMENTGGEPDVIAYDKTTDTFTFCDCSMESPSKRRNLCYDQKSLNERKEFKPKGTAQGLADSMGVKLMSEDEYLSLQSLGSFDQKTSSWLYTPEPIRRLGGAIFGDRRYNHVFIYHNGASSYYAARGFRATIAI